MSMVLLRGAAEQGFIYSLVALGLYLSFRTLNIADLTVDGSFTLGAAAAAALTILGHPVLGLLAAVFAGSLAGFVTAVLQTKLKVQPILAGIITMTALYSINLRVMGNRSNLPLLREDTIFTLFSKLLPSSLKSYSKLILSLLFAVLTAVLLIIFLRTRLGLSIRATGDNRTMVSSSSINPAYTTTVGLCLANAMVSLSGGLLAQYQMFAEITLGTGMVVIGLASLIIGEVLCDMLFRSPSVARAIFAAVVGAVIYRIIIALALSASVSTSDLKLVSAVIVMIAISYPAVRDQYRLYRLRKEAQKNVDA
ncbi:MAG: ABC-type transporter, integral rane subunit [Oscillospiraceae bacterium]|jgi:putative ABC transport system permease protein|nr:ABC-type transporter, integral rane subunit [Oscillospiraceae bacterium]